MARNNYNRYREPGDRISGYHDRRSITGTNSPRVNGVLKFRQNTLADQQVKLTVQPMFRYWSNPNYPKDYFIGGLGLTAAENTHFDSIPANAWTPPDLRATVESKLRSKIGGVAVNVPDLLRTRMESVNMVLSTLGRIRKSYSALRKGKLKKAAQHLGANLGNRKFRGASPPELWLELQYGWKPLLGDIWTLIDNPFSTVTGRLTATSRQSYNFDKGKWRASNCDNTRSARMNVRATASIQVTLDSSAVSAASQLGLTNPALVVWEAVPFSFVVDWAYPVGDFLESLGRYHGISLSDYSCTFRAEMSSYVFHDFRSTIKPKYGDAKTQSSNLSSIRKTRVLSKFPLREIPSFQNPFTSEGRIANALSLLAVTFGQKPRN